MCIFIWYAYINSNQINQWFTPPPQKKAEIILKSIFLNKINTLSVDILWLSTFWSSKILWPPPIFFQIFFSVKFSCQIKWQSLNRQGANVLTLWLMRIDGIIHTLYFVKLGDEMLSRKSHACAVILLRRQVYLVSVGKQMKRKTNGHSSVTSR